MCGNSYAPEPVGDRSQPADREVRESLGIRAYFSLKDLKLNDYLILASFHLVSEKIQPLSVFISFCSLIRWRLDLLERSDVYGGGTSADADGLMVLICPSCLMSLSILASIRSSKSCSRSLNHSAEYVSPIVGIWLLVSSRASCTLQIKSEIASSHTSSVG